MLVCPACGASNRNNARFCTQCSTPLASVRPSTDDSAWLAATLAGDSASNAPASTSDDSPARQGDTPPVGHTAAPALQPGDVPAMSSSAVPPGQPGDTPAAGAVAGPDLREILMEQPQTDVAPKLFADRYELVTQHDDAVEVIDRRPWTRCWACDTASNEPGELFCTECGASLDGRRYHGQLLEGEPHGLALVPEISDEHARAVLPQIWDQVREDKALLTLVALSNRAPVTLPVDELDALRIGRGIAQLIETLHAGGFQLGPVEPSAIEVTATGEPQLRAVPGLRRVADPAVDPAEDLRALAGLIEALTATPRTTQRLDEGEADAVEPGLPDVLRALRTGEITTAPQLARWLDELVAARTAPPGLWVRIGAASHQGMVRELDEDSLLTLDLRTVQNSHGRAWGLYIVADGMGGHAAGEVASGLAIRGAAEVVMSAYLSPTLDADSVDEEARLKEVVRAAILQGNEYVRREAEARGNDMGTTMTLALVAGDRAIVGNVGDSRTYLYRAGKLSRVSKDHSLVQRLVDLGQITEDEVYTHPQRNAVLRSLGDRAELEVDTFSLRLHQGDALLLCSDGQWEMTRDPEIAAILAAHSDPQAACQALIDAANRAGGDDNITVVLVLFEPYHPV